MTQKTGIICPINITNWDADFIRVVRYVVKDLRGYAKIHGQKLDLPLTTDVLFWATQIEKTIDNWQKNAELQRPQKTSSTIENPGDRKSSE